MFFVVLIMIKGHVFLYLHSSALFDTGIVKYIISGLESNSLFMSFIGMHLFHMRAQALAKHLESFDPLQY